MMFAAESFPEIDSVFTVRHEPAAELPVEDDAEERRRAPRCGGLSFEAGENLQRGMLLDVTLVSKQDDSLRFEVTVSCERSWWENGRWMAAVRFDDDDAGLLASVHTMLSLHLRDVSLDTNPRAAEGH